MPSSTASGARSGVGAESRTPSSAARSSASVITRSAPPTSSMASSSPPLPAASKVASTPSATLRTFESRLAAVANRRGSELSDERLVARRPSDDVEPLPNRQLRGNGPDGASRAQNQERLAPRNAELAEHSDRRLDRRGKRGGVVPRHVRRLGRPVLSERVLPVTAERWQPCSHLVSDPSALDATADAFDGSGGLKPEDRGLRQRHDRRELATTDLQVCRADAGAWTLIRICVSDGSGIVTSSHWRTSGEP